MATERTMKLKGGSLLYVSITGWFGERREATTNDQLDTLVKLLPPAYFKDIKEVQGEAYRASKPYTLSFPIRGVRFIPDALLPRVEKILETLKDRYATAADDLLANYQKAKDEAKFNLDTRYREERYLSPEALRSRYRMVYTIFSVDASEAALQSAAGVGTLLDEFKNEAYSSLVSEFKKTLSEMVDRLDEGKKFKNSSINGFTEFVTNFSALASVLKYDVKFGASINEVERLAEQVRQLMAGVSPEDLRDKDASSVRVTVQGALATVNARLHEVMVEAGSRNLLVTPLEFSSEE